MPKVISALSLAALAEISPTSRCPKKLIVLQGSSTGPTKEQEILFRCFRASCPFQSARYAHHLRGSEVEALIAYEKLRHKTQEENTHDWEFVRKAAELPAIQALNPTKHTPVALARLSKLREQLANEISLELKLLAKLVVKTRVGAYRHDK